MLDIAERLERAGYSTWCVGGAVRDALLGHAHLDWDLATAATPDQVRAVFGPRRTIPIGIEFGTVGVLDRDAHLHEVTTFRRDVSTDGRHAVVAFGGTIEDDLARRDFTINAIAYHPATRELSDPFGGQEDLARGIVRAVGVPEERMREDRLRALRALRFAGRLGFSLDAATWNAIVASAPHMTRLSAERVKQEIEKTLEQVEKPAQAFRLWQESGALAVLVPALAAVEGDAFAPLDCLPRPRPRGRPYRKLLRLAALFAPAGSRGAAAALTALRFSRADINMVAMLVDRADRLAPEMDGAEGRAVPDAQVRRWVATAGRLNVALVMRLIAARRLGATAHLRSLYRRMAASAFRDPVELSDLAIDGDDLRRGGIPAGPGLGKILQALLDRVIEAPELNAPGTLLAIARELYDAGPGSGPGGTTTTQGS